MLASLLLALPAHLVAAAPQQDWPQAPVVEVSWTPRDSTEPLLHEFEAPPGAWIEVEGGRLARLGLVLDRTAVRVWLEQFDGIEATRVTVAAINGLQGAGPRYFERLVITVDDTVLEDLEGRHVILPRGALIRRTSVGRDLFRLRSWSFVDDDLPVPAWAPAAADADTQSRLAFPFRNQAGEAIDLGPYNFFWPNKSLQDSHGGFGIGPYHGGPEDWLRCAAGRRNREAEALLDFQRPIWMLDEDLEPLALEVPYWMGRTLQHDPPGYHYELDDWCPYARRLAEYHFADYTHLSRGTAGAAAVAPWDAFAADCLRMVWADFRTANSMTRVVGATPEGEPLLHPGALQQNPLLWPLWKKIEEADGPRSSDGHRGLAHWLRLARWCRPYVPEEERAPYEEGLRAFVRALADDYGVTGTGSGPAWPAMEGGRLSAPLEPPYTLAFHQQLVTYECQRFGGLEDIGEKGARFLTPRPPFVFEVRDGEPGDTVLDRGHSADERQAEPMWAYEAYGNMTHDELLGWSGPAQFLAAMQPRGVNGSSQDLDQTPRHLWESALRRPVRRR